MEPVRTRNYKYSLVVKVLEPPLDFISEHLNQELIRWRRLGGVFGREQGRSTTEELEGSLAAN